MPPKEYCIFSTSIFDSITEQSEKLFNVNDHYRRELLIEHDTLIFKAGFMLLVRDMMCQCYDQHYWFWGHSGFHTESGGP